jgi:hypothetical protein
MLAGPMIVEEKCAYSVLFFHQEKSFHDHWASRPGDGMRES